MRAVSHPKTFQTIQDGDGNSRLRKCLVDEFKEAVLNFQAPNPTARSFTHSCFSNDPLASIINHSYSTKRSPTVVERPGTAEERHDTGAKSIARRRQRGDNNSHIDFASNDRLEKTEDVAGSTAGVDPAGMDPAEAAEYPKKVTLTMLDRNGDPSDKLVVYIKQKEHDPTAKTTSEEL